VALNAGATQRRDNVNCISKGLLEMVLAIELATHNLDWCAVLA